MQTQYKEVNITFRTDEPFIYFIYGKDDELLYIGHTDDLNKKAFSFPFEYEKITGYYFPFRWVVEDEVDALIVARKPTRCRPRYGLKLSNLKDWIKEKTGAKFKRSEWKEWLKKIDEGDIYIYEGEAYITSLGREILKNDILEEYGTRDF